MTTEPTEPAEPADTAPTPAFSRRRRVLVASVLFAVTLASAGGVALWRLAWMAPAWWSDVAPDHRQTAALADRVEYRLAEEAHRIRPGDDSWRLRITEDQVNAWLSSRLPAWLAHAQDLQWPPQLGTPQVHFVDGAVHVGLDYSDDGRRRYLVATLQPRVVAGRLALVLHGVAFGRLAVPGGSVRTLIETYRDVVPERFLQDPSVQRIIDLLIDEQRIDPVVTLSDGRRVRLLEIRPRRGDVILRCRTETADRARE